MASLTKPTNAPVTRHLVRCSKFDHLSDVLFIMESNDFRFDDGNYTPIAEGAFEKGKAQVDEGDWRKWKVFRTTDGRRFRVFNDWSVGDEIVA